MALTKRKTALP